MLMFTSDVKYLLYEHQLDISSDLASSSWIAYFIAIFVGNSRNKSYLSWFSHLPMFLYTSDNQRNTIRIFFIL